MSEQNKNGGTRKAVRQVLMASAALAPIWMYAPEVAAQAAPVVNAGPDRTVQATTNDGDANFEYITMAGSAVPGNSSGGQLIVVWLDAGGKQLGSGATTQLRLPNGVNQLTLKATDSGNSSVFAVDTVVITVQGPIESAAATPNQQSLGQTLDSLCGRLVPFDPNAGVNAPPTLARAQKVRNSQNLSDRCTELLYQTNAADKAKALAQLGADEFNSIRTLATVFSQTQFQSVMDRLHGLRAGERGLSLAGLSFNNDGRTISGDQAAQGLKTLIGGASADEAGGLLDDRLGFWLRGNYGNGKKVQTQADAGFKANQFGISGGVDYRFGADTILGASLGYGKSNLDFNSASNSGLDSKSLALSLYGSAFVGGLYLDAVGNYIKSSYDTERHITVPIDVSAVGSTDGKTLSGGVALGYDFAFGGFTLAPSVGYYYVKSSLDAFEETGGMGLDLAFNDQTYKSSTANAGIRMSYAWKTSWGVVMPHFRGTWVHEFNKDAEVFNVHFADDVPAPTPPTPPIVVTSDDIDQSYFRLAAGLSLQMKYGISGYFDYQTIQGFENVTFHDFTLGLRVQHSF